MLKFHSRKISTEVSENYIPMLSWTMISHSSAYLIQQDIQTLTNDLQNINAVQLESG